MTTLAEQIAQLSNPTPVFEDPEDADDQGAKLVERFEDEEAELGEDVTVSKLRRQTSGLLAESDRRYAGKKVSRIKVVDTLRKMDGDSQEDEERIASDADLDADDGDDDDDDESDDDDSDDSTGDNQVSDEEEEIDLGEFKAQLKIKGTQHFSFKDDGDFGKYADDDLVDEGSDDDANDSDDDDYDSDDDESAQSEGEEETAEEEGVEQFSKAKVDEEIQKGQAARGQLGLWDGLLESRIKIQKALIQVNKLPQHTTWKAFSQKGGQDFKQAANESQTALKTLLDQLVNLQTALLLQNPETRHIVEGHGKPQKNDADDEEIPSDSEIESDDEEKKPAVQARKRKIPLDEYPEFLAKRHKDFQSYRNQTIQKWNEKTQLASGKMSSKFSAFDQSALQQIQQILSDRGRLLKRTQVRRSTYRVFGKSEEEEKLILDENVTEALPRRQHLQQEDTEIFDDDDFYHQLLRELIERKSSDTDDPATISRQWLEVQKLRGKVKKEVDRKASKGRKLRFDIHPKLVNYMASYDTSSWVEESRDELFNSLFGGKAKQPAAER
ncbi:protein AATF-like [Lineus longissimus]|uniref:protein AATF-like n=1 Tax=Lineus longissimus TaxID=88925 RepID=UPI002B4C4E27